MEAHRYFINGIPRVLWKEFTQACLYFDTTAKDHFISSMQDLVIRYHHAKEDVAVLSKFEYSEEEKP